MRAFKLLSAHGTDTGLVFGDGGVLAGHGAVSLLRVLCFECLATNTTNALA
jgi:hypothetical protein